VFKLEAFRAKWGDALLIHYGSKAEPMYALIDGGPPGTWDDVLRPALAELRPGPDKALSLSWIALSHVDEDHVTGVLDLFEEWDTRATEDGNPQRVIAASTTLFHNMPGPSAPQHGTAAVRPAPNPKDPRVALEARMAAVDRRLPVTGVASYQQGSRLGDIASNRNVDRNPTSGSRLLTGDELTDAVVGPLRVRVVSPTPAIVDRLITEWEKEVAKIRPGVATVGRVVERKIQNLSSIVLLVEQGTKKMLLCGDALDLDVLAGLEALGLRTAGDPPFQVDLLKLPHHGSRANNHREQFAGIKARHYVISANGRFDNPDESTIDLLLDTEKDREIDIWLTSPEGVNGASGKTFDERLARLRARIAAPDVTGTITVHLPGPNDRSVIVTVRS
jgi:beta-lactamase superfamily II metal-dependent hydrolase